MSASLIGGDVNLVIRVAKNIYPKLGAGFFSCKSTVQSDSSIQGLCAGAGLNFLLGGHFCIEIGAKYYPVVKIGGFETVSTAGTSYNFPASKLIISSGVAPFMNIGWVF